MAVEELLPSSRPLGPLVWALNEHGCALTLLPGPPVPGTVKVRLLYPEDEYLEKRCRRILTEWLARTDMARRGGDAASSDRPIRSRDQRDAHEPVSTRIRSLT